MQDAESSSTIFSSEWLLGLYLVVIILLLAAGTSLPYWLDRSEPSIVISDLGADKVIGPAGQTAGEGASIAATLRPDQASADLPAESDVGGTDAAMRVAELDVRAAPGTLSDATNDTFASLGEVDFDLGERTSAPPDARLAGGNRIEVQKTLFAQGAPLGSLTVTVDQNARLFLRGAQLNELLKSSAISLGASAKIASNELISFQRLREDGINLRYDPMDDRIILQP